MKKKLLACGLILSALVSFSIMGAAMSWTVSDDGDMIIDGWTVPTIPKECVTMIDSLNKLDQMEMSLNQMQFFKECVNGVMHVDCNYDYGLLREIGVARNAIKTARDALGTDSFLTFYNSARQAHDNAAWGPYSIWSWWE